MTARFGVTYRNPTRFTTLQLFNFIQCWKMNRVMVGEQTPGGSLSLAPGRDRSPIQLIFASEVRQVTSNIDEKGHRIFQFELPTTKFLLEREPNDSVFHPIWGRVLYGLGPDTGAPAI